MLRCRSPWVLGPRMKSKMSLHSGVMTRSKRTRGCWLSGSVELRSGSAHQPWCLGADVGGWAGVKSGRGGEGRTGRTAPRSARGGRRARRGAPPRVTRGTRPGAASRGPAAARCAAAAPGPRPSPASPEPRRPGPSHAEGGRSSAAAALSRGWRASGRGLALLMRNAGPRVGRQQTRGNLWCHPHSLFRSGPTLNFSAAHQECSRSFRPEGA